MKIKKGDYCVARQDQGRDYLFKALSDNDAKSVEAVLEKNSHIQGMRYTLTVELSDVVLNLGPDPYPGKVYGFDVSTVFRARKQHDEFGDIHWFYKPKDKQVIKDLWASMDKVASKLKKQSLGFLLDNVVFEIIPYNKEKYAGMYLPAKSDKVPPRIQIRPEIMPATEYPYVWYHELGHHLHTFVTSKKLNAHWLRLYNTSIKVISVKKDKSQDLLDLLMGGEECPSDFKSGLDEEDALAYKWIIRTIGQVNGLTIRDLDTLFEADCKEDIKKLWPIRNIPRKELAPIVSDYATKNVKELFAECFAFYMVKKKKLPDQIVKLLEKSISYAKANHGKPNSED